jgi:hypothetical protein
MRNIKELCLVGLCAAVVSASTALVMHRLIDVREPRLKGFQIADSQGRTRMSARVRDLDIVEFTMQDTGGIYSVKLEEPSPYGGPSILVFNTNAFIDLGLSGKRAHISMRDQEGDIVFFTDGIEIHGSKGYRFIRYEDLPWTGYRWKRGSPNGPLEDISAGAAENPQR